MELNVAGVSCSISHVDYAIAEALSDEPQGPERHQLTELSHGHGHGHGHVLQETLYSDHQGIVEEEEEEVKSLSDADITV